MQDRASGHYWAILAISSTLILRDGENLLALVARWRYGCEPFDLGTYLLRDT